MDDLVVAENINAIELYSDDNSLDALMGQIAETSKSMVFDITKAKGRKDIASLAYKISRSKTVLDNMGKGLVDDWKAKAKIIDNKRKNVREKLDDLRDEIRAPLDEWENAEKERVAAIENRISSMKAVADAAVEGWKILSMENMAAALEEIKNNEIDDNWEEYQDQAEEAKLVAITKIEKAIEEREKYDADQAELETLRQQKVAQEQKDRDEDIRKEAEAKAKTDAEAAQQAAIDAKEAAERREQEAKDNAAQQAKEAAQAERQRIADEQAEEERQTKAREEDMEHRRKINNTAVINLRQHTNLDEEAATAVIAAIARKQITNVEIKY